MGNSRKARLLVRSLPAPLAENPYQELLYRALAAHGVALDPRSPFDLKSLSETTGPRLLHVHWIWLKTGSLARPVRYLRAHRFLRVARHAGWKTLWTAHNITPHDGNALDRRLARDLARGADAVIAHSEWAATEIDRMYGRHEGVTVIPHGHYRDAYPPPPDSTSARLALELPLDRPIILAFGQARPYKGLEELIARFVAHPELDAHLVIAGRPLDPAYARTLEILAGTDPRIDLRLGFVPEDDVPRYFGAASWAVFPFRAITTSGSMILAASFGVPAIIPNHPALLETLPEDAVVTYDDDVADGLARALAADRETAARATTRSLDALAWEPIAQRTADIMEAITRDQS